MWRCWAILLLIVLVGAWSVQAQTSTPTPGPTPTVTATYDLYQYLTVVPPGEVISHGGAIRYEVNLGDFMIALLLFGILVLALTNLSSRFRGKS
jgi:hypothetical protein